jgi:ubiquinone biosynthesis protein Coq4
MMRNGLDPAAIPTLPSETAGAFVRAHLYETHDIWHAVVGFSTDVAGELGLQGFYMAQIHGPLPPVILAAGLLNTAFGAPQEFHPRMSAITEGWRAGTRARALFGVNWDEHWGRPLDEVRRELGLPTEGVSPDWRRVPARLQSA